MPRVIAHPVHHFFPKPVKNICVFCGSKTGNNPHYKKIATQLGKALVDHDLGLVYGGAYVGLMGAVANSVLDHGGRAIGVIPDSLTIKEVAHPRLTELHYVASMHDRKRLMADLADGFIALPGGFGTLDELFEILTWRQLQIHEKPVGLLNVDGFYDPLVGFLEQARSRGFLGASHYDLLLQSSDISQLLQRFLELPHTSGDRGAILP